MPAVVLRRLTLLSQGSPLELSCHAIWQWIALTPTHRLFYICGTTQEGPLILACCLNSPTVRADSLAEIHRGAQALLPLAAYSDCLVQISPSYRVLRGNWSQTRIEFEAAGSKLSLHLGGVSVWFDQGLGTGSFCVVGCPSLSFTCQQLAVWGEE
jgi:hypothetical protein